MRNQCGVLFAALVHTVPPPHLLSPLVNRASDGTLPIPSLVLLFIPCSRLYPSSSLRWSWPAQGSHTIPLGSSAHRRYAAVKPHRTAQRPIRRPATPTSLQASSRWFSQATSSESAASLSSVLGSNVLIVAERTTLLSLLETSTSASQLTQHQQTFGSSPRGATLLNASPCPNIL